MDANFGLQDIKNSLRNFLPKRKVRLGFYPYTYARVAVMKSNLIKKSQWHTYMKMSEHELMRVLQDGEYRAEMTGLHPDKHSLAQIESALHRGMMRTFVKLKRISDPNVQRVLSMYFLRHDIENIKLIVRAKAVGESLDEIMPLLMPSINYSESFFVSLADKKTVDEVVSALPFDINFSGHQTSAWKMTPRSAPITDVLVIENKLDNYYADQLFYFSERLAGQGKVFRAFIETELDNMNIKILLRLIRAGMKPDSIVKFLIHPTKKLVSIADSGTALEAIKRLSAMGMLKIDSSLSERDSYAAVEMDIDTQLIKREYALMNQYPLTVNFILGFMLAKEIEVRNLKILLKGKHFNLDNATIERLVVTA